jgi:hypothetical protein
MMVYGRDVAPSVSPSWIYIGLSEPCMTSENVLSV